MSSKCILIIDDDKRTAEQYCEKIKKASQKSSEVYSFECLSGDNLLTEFKKLEKRQNDQRKGEIIELKGTKFDKAELLVLDFDLTSLGRSDTVITGELVAYYALVFSNCGPIISFNRRRRIFDLSLIGEVRVWSDIDLSGADLSNYGLWAYKWGRNYRPWSWPFLPYLIRIDNKRIKEAEEGLDQTIKKFLDIPDDISKVMPRELMQMIGSLDAKLIDLAKLRLLFPKDAKVLKNNQLARIASRLLARWLDSIVLPGQHILVDLPHLIYRFPALLRNKSRELKVWNNAVRFFAKESKIVGVKKLNKHQFKRNLWLNRDAWWSDRVDNEKSLTNMNKSVDVGAIPVFAEDASRFYKASECKEFAISIFSPYSRRWVKEFSGIEYEPKSRYL